MTVSRERVLETLERGWGRYVTAYDELSSEGKLAYLQRQGFMRFADVLAHVMAWWNEGRLLITAYVNNPHYKPGERDVDRFNAAAVQAFADRDEEAIRRAFEEARRSMIEFVLALPPESFQSESVMAQLNMEVVGHLAEHTLSEY